MCLYTVTRVYIVYAIDVVLFKKTFLHLVCHIVYIVHAIDVIFIQPYIFLHCLCPKWSYLKVYVKKCDADNT